MNGYQYVALRCVPRVDREEFVNVGVVLYCQAEDFLGWNEAPGLTAVQRKNHGRLFQPVHANSVDVIEEVALKRPLLQQIQR